ncbi:hypothetical protein J7K05_02115 [bacterium]|nr:hypothetical protein [bacterium]
MAKKGTSYDATLRDTSPKGGITDLNTGKTTQYYPDNYRVSWHDPGQTNFHWTNQNVARGHSARHSPPKDSRK